jgi:hypothetical protein
MAVIMPDMKIPVAAARIMRAGARCARSAMHRDRTSICVITRRVLWLGIVAAVAICCDAPNNQQLTDVAAIGGDTGAMVVPPFVLKPGQSAILPERLTAQLDKLCSRPAPEFTHPWLPTKAHVHELESRLSEINSLLARLPTPRGGRLTINDYVRQYFGVVISDHRMIYINALLKSRAGDSWDHEVLNTCDGGASAWGSLYDVESKTFSDFRIN